MAIERFATDGLPASQRLRYWNDLIDRVFDGTHVNAEEGSFDGSVLAWRVGRLAMLRPSASRSVVGRRRTIRDEEHVILHLVSRGRGRQVQGGREIEMDPGDFTLCAVEYDYDLEFQPHELSVVEFPKAPLLERLPHLESALCSKIAGSTPAGRIFHDFLLSLWRHGERSMPEPGWQEDVERVFYDLLAMAVRHRDGASYGERHGKLGERINAFIESRLADPDLRTQTIAAEFGLSERAIQQIFAAAGTTPSAFILDRRLRKAADTLRAQPDASITRVAFATGFNDSAYFSRCFRDRFGASPRSWRNGDSGLD